MKAMMKTIAVIAMLLVSAGAFAQSGTFGTGLTWTLSGGTLTIGGSGAMPASLSAGANLQPWYAVRNNITSAVIADSVTGTLSVGAFEGCANLATVNLGKGITEIRGVVFEGTAITSITIPEQIVRIDIDAFRRANKLETVYYNAANCADAAAILDHPPFHGTKTPALTTVVIGSSVRRIPNQIFSGANSLRTLTIESGLVHIGDRSFSNCTSLTSIVIPDSVQIIDAFAFDGCSSVTSITLGSEVSEIRQGAFSGTRITELTIPQNVAKIRGNSFGNSTRLQTVHFNAANCGNVDVDSPFNGSGTLTAIIFGDNVRQVPGYIAAGLTGLETVTLGSRVNQIGYGAFMGCVALEEVNNRAARPLALVGSGNAIFEKVDKSFCVLRVPSASVTAYRAANIWKDFQIEAF